MKIILEIRAAKAGTYITINREGEAENKYQALAAAFVESALLQAGNAFAKYCKEQCMADNAPSN